MTLKHRPLQQAKSISSFLQPVRPIRVLQQNRSQSLFQLDLHPPPCHPTVEFVQMVFWWDWLVAFVHSETMLLRVWKVILNHTIASWHSFEYSIFLTWALSFNGMTDKNCIQMELKCYSRLGLVLRMQLNCMVLMTGSVEWSTIRSFYDLPTIREAARIAAICCLLIVIKLTWTPQWRPHIILYL